jgi:hypothetical protein
MMYHIVPSTWWSGDHRRVETIEMLEWEETEGAGGDGLDRTQPLSGAEDEASETPVAQASGDGRERQGVADREQA